MERLETLVDRLESCVDKLDNPAYTGGGVTPAASSEVLQASRKALLVYESMVTAVVPTLTAKTTKLIKDKESTEASVACFTECLLLTRRVIHASFRCQKPSEKQRQTVLKPIIDSTKRGKSYAEKGLVSEMLNVFSFVGEEDVSRYMDFVIGECQAKADSITEKKPSSDVLDWVDTAMTSMQQVANCFKEIVPRSVVWNSAGKDLGAFLLSHPLTVAPVGMGSSGGEQMAAAVVAYGNMKVMSDSSSKGGEVADPHRLPLAEGGTANLKPVAKEQRERRSLKGLVKDVDSPAKAPIRNVNGTSGGYTGPRGEAFSGPDRGSWVVRNQDCAPELVTVDHSQVSMKSSVKIEDCYNTRIAIPEKVNCVTIDKCADVALVLQDVIATVEVLNSSLVKIEVTGRVPSVVIDLSAGVSLRLSRESVELTQITTAKSSEVNVEFQSAEENIVELPIPEQFVSFVKDGKMITKPSAHACC
eukprot:Filipodium_phascolosomae@DN2255_c0_g1_i1.p1